MTAVVTVLVFSLAWAGFGIVSGWVGARLPAAWLDIDRGVLRLQPFEARGRCYDRWLRLRAWKDRLPEAGSLFNGGLSKARMSGFDRSNFVALAAATRRAELVHRSNVGFGFTFGLWNSWPIGVFMALFGIVVHLPFIVVQRYNRARVDYLLLNRERARGTVR